MFRKFPTFDFSKTALFIIIWCDKSDVSKQIPISGICSRGWHCLLLLVTITRTISMLQYTDCGCTHSCKIYKISTQFLGKDAINVCFYCILVFSVPIILNQHFQNVYSIILNKTHKHYCYTI